MMEPMQQLELFKGEEITLVDGDKWDLFLWDNEGLDNQLHKMRRYGIPLDKASFKLHFWLRVWNGYLVEPYKLMMTHESEVVQGSVVKHRKLYTEGKIVDSVMWKGENIKEKIFDWVFDTMLFCLYKIAHGHCIKGDSSVKG